MMPLGWLGWSWDGWWWDVQVERPGGTCLEGRNRVLGWPSDLCDGTFNNTFNTLVDVLQHAGAMNYPGSEEDHMDLQVRLPSLHCIGWNRSTHQSSDPGGSLPPQHNHPHIALICLLPRELTSLSPRSNPGVFARRKGIQACFS